MKRRKIFLFIFFAPLSLALFGDNCYFIEFCKDTLEGSGWNLENVKFYSTGVKNAYLSSSSSHLDSPVFSTPVEKIRIGFMASSSSTGRKLVVRLFDGEGKQVGEERSFAAPASRGTAEVACAGGDGVACFSIGADTGSGTIPLYDCVVEFADGAVPAPCGLENCRVTGSSFVGTWRECGGAGSYLVDLMRVDERSSAWGGEVLAEDFAGAVNEKGNPVELKDMAALFPMLGGERVYIPAHTNGFVQIGTGDRPGFVVLAGCPVQSGEAVRFRAKRYVSGDEGTVMPLLWTDGHATNAFAAVELGNEMADYEVPLDGVPEGALVMLHSTTNRSTAASARGRVWLDSVSVVSGYVPPQTATNSVEVSRRTYAPCCKFRDLTAGSLYLWRVRAVSEGGVSEPSALKSVVPEGAPDWGGIAVYFR